MSPSRPRSPLRTCGRTTRWGECPGSLLRIKEMPCSALCRPTPAERLRRSRTARLQDRDTVRRKGEAARSAGGRKQEVFVDRCRAKPFAVSVCEERCWRRDASLTVRSRQGEPAGEYRQRRAEHRAGRVAGRVALRWVRAVACRVARLCRRERCLSANAQAISSRQIDLPSISPRFCAVMRGNNVSMFSHCWR